MNALKFSNFINQLLKINSFHFKRKMNTEIFQNISHDSKITSSINDPSQNIVWFDGEMTGLDENKQTLIEAAIIITDGNLNILAESQNIIIHQPDSVLENMEDWPKNHHAMTGLTESVKKSNISIEKADEMLYEFIKPFTPKGMCPLAGNSIYMDRIFIRKYMPKLNNHLSYRLIDVSSVRELFKRWIPEELKKGPVKKNRHRALDDIQESLKELQFYKNYFKS